MTYEKKNFLSQPVDAILFDCDGTLSSIEGIDELARLQGVGQEVSQLTADAMGHTGLNPALYQKRLELVLPTSEQVTTLAQTYFEHRMPNCVEVIQRLKQSGKAVYVISAGLYPSVEGFAKLLQVETENVFAVPILFDEKGQYCDFDQTSPLVHGNGKRTIVEQIRAIHPRVAYIGDGLNDYAVYDLVTRFIGYGGAYYRENIAKLCEYYVSKASFFELLPFCLTEVEMSNQSAVC